VKVQLSDLHSKVLAGVTKVSYQDEDAKMITNILLYAQLRGNNQDITKIATGGMPNKWR
jgi:hypothetical protein